MEFHSEQRKKLGSILNFDECEGTHDDLHPKVVINGEKSKGFQQKERVERKLRESGELVMYMSCLPSYLERGETPQDKPFNVGVLDWRLLQNWQHNTNAIVGVNSQHSPSTSNSTAISSKGSSSYSSSDNTWPHHRQKIKYPSPPTEACLSGAKLVAGSGRGFLDCKNGSVDLLRMHHRSLQETQCSGADTVNGLTDCKSKDRGLQNVTGTRTKPLETDDIISSSKGGDMIRKGEASKSKEQVSSPAIIARDSSKSHIAAVPKSRNDPGNTHVTVDNGRTLEENRYTFYGGCREKACRTKSRPDHTRFYSFASERVKTKDSQVEKSCTKEIKNLNCPSSEEQTMQFSERVSTNPSERKNLEKKNSGSKPVKLAENKNFQMKEGVSESTKVRNPSPTRRFSFAMGKFGKSVNPNPSVNTANLVSENNPDSKIMSSDKSNGTTRARSSPLRRLLDPILKPKGVDSHDLARSSERNPSTTGRTLESSAGQIEGTTGVKHGASSSVQALLQVAVKNGLPLFTFTVDNCSDILAATVKELSSNKATRSWIYTFLSFSKMKKKNGGQRRNQGSKDKNLGYMPNVIAQMTVSDILNTDSTGKGYVRREFVLSSVGTRDADQTSDSYPGDELAAIIIRFPERMPTQRGTSGIPHCSNSEDEQGNESANGDLFSTTVILAGGHHGVPRKGEPSPLIERWRNGGSCDCGGWDLGCQIRTLTNDKQLNQQSNSVKSQTTLLKLFSQEEAEEERAMWTLLSAFEDGIFSVAFSSSLKQVQAFSIGVAALHSRTSVVSSPNTFQDIMASENNVSKIFNQAQLEVSAKYAAYPPLSPVGRV